MSYNLYDVNGFVSFFTNISGLRQLREEVESRSFQYRHLRKFIEEGSGYITDNLLKETKAFKLQLTNKRLRLVCDALIESMEKGELHLIISQT